MNYKYIIDWLSFPAFYWIGYKTVLPGQGSVLHRATLTLSPVQRLLLSLLQTLLSLLVPPLQVALQSPTAAHGNHASKKNKIDFCRIFFSKMKKRWSTSKKLHFSILLINIVSYLIKCVSTRLQLQQPHKIRFLICIKLKIR